MKKRWIAAALILISCALFFVFKNTGLIPAKLAFDSKNNLAQIKETKTLDVRVFFGYKDARPARFVADRYEKALFIKLLTSPCTVDRFDCDFAPLITDEESTVTTLIKSYDLPNGIRKQITVRIFDSSVGADDDENRKNPFQKWKSEFIEKEFVTAIHDADIIFYNGHSRAGGGPDFSPPKLVANNHVDYEYYRRHQKGLTLILDTLKQNPDAKLKSLSLYSCKSDQLFRNKIARTKKDLKVSGSRQLLYFSDAMNESLGQLSQLTQSFFM